MKKLTVEENANFRHVTRLTYELVTDETIKNIRRVSAHMANNDRNNRRVVAASLDKKAHVVASFLVDKGHKDGQEVHVVTNNGIIYVFNHMKLFLGAHNALVTILIARPNQVERLFEACGMPVDEAIIAKCKEHQARGLNHC